MTPERLNQILEVGFGNDINSMAKFLGITFKELKEMLDGIRPIPSWIQERFDQSPPDQPSDETPTFP